MDTPGPYLQTVSGRRVNPLDLDPADIDIGDIAVALSNLCRFGGHSRAFYSVAQHSVIIADELARQKADAAVLLAALLHDASEAYLGDLPHPLKHRSELGASFKSAEQRIEDTIQRRFDLPEASAQIKPIDRSLLATERETFSSVAWHWPELDGVSALAVVIEPWEPAQAARVFLERYESFEAARRR